MQVKAESRPMHVRACAENRIPIINLWGLQANMALRNSTKRCRAAVARFLQSHRSQRQEVHRQHQSGTGRLPNLHLLQVRQVPAWARSAERSLVPRDIKLTVDYQLTVVDTLMLKLLFLNMVEESVNVIEAHKQKYQRST